jgi:cytochrome P450/NADPH-cytochrome P450 reductase
MTGPATIPYPPKMPVLGHLHKIAGGRLSQFLLKTGIEYPEGLFSVWFGNREALFVGDPDIVAELSDENRFRKIPPFPLIALRRIAGDGLFTAFTDEPNWGKAHRVLMPAFSHRAMRGYFEMILEVSEQLAAKWAELVGKDIAVSDDMTRLTLDSIAIAGFGQTFGSFDKVKLDPFLEAMGVALEHTLTTLTRHPIQRRFAPKREARELDASINTMNALVDRLIAERRANPDSAARDLLNLMLTAEDPETGERLDDLNIRYQVLTFLVAGHETTSGLLTFAIHLLLRHPHVLARAYAEVDRVLPDTARFDYRDIAKLDVISRVLDETLRLWPTAPGFTVAPYADDTLGGRYSIKANQQINIVTTVLHRSPKAWEQPEEFDIERWLPSHSAGHHPHGYKPFGNGERACIGRQFALMEAKIALAVILQKFALSDPHGYRLKIKESLTIKPDDLRIRARLRRPAERLVFSKVGDAVSETGGIGSIVGAGQQLTVLYGTSLGTSREVAEQIAGRADRDGFETTTMSIDEAFDARPKQGILVVVTATYNGRAPDTAVRLEKAIAADELANMRWTGMRFAILGIGNSQWPNYQAFPKLVDAALEATGAQRLMPRGEANGDGDFDGAVEAFLQSLWAALGATAETPNEAMLDVTVVDRVATRQSVLTGRADVFEIIENRELVTPASDGLWDFTVEPPRGSTRHVSLRLPEGTTYRTGDHLAVHARNRPERVAVALTRLGVAGDAVAQIGSGAPRYRHLPLGEAVSVRQLLEDYVDLQETVQRRTLEQLGAQTRCPHKKESLAALAGEGYQTDVVDKRLTLLDVLDRYPAVEISLAQFIALSPAIQPRFYSIASSPRLSPDTIDLLVGTVSAPAWSGMGQHEGLASTFMRDGQAGDRVLGFVRSPNPSFSTPEDASLPMILVGPGTGFAPFRGFLQERATQSAAGGQIGLSLLFYGCRHPEHDWLYRAEMERWAVDGVVSLHIAFSAVPSHPWRFVQDALWAEQDRVWHALKAGAPIYVCGDGRYMAPAVRDTLIRIHMQKAGAAHDASSAWLEQMIEDGRYHQDVFGFGK